MQACLDLAQWLCLQRLSSRRKHKYVDMSEVRQLARMPSIEGFLPIKGASSVKQSTAHRVAILAFDGVVPFDLTMACEMFGRVPLAPGKIPYEVLVCAQSNRIRTKLFDMRIRWGLSHAVNAQTVIIPGLDDVLSPIPNTLLEAIRAAEKNGARIASLCSGAFILARTRLLDGLRATTHWRGVQLLADLFPQVTVDPNVLFVDNGRILTSAGACAGMDLCLHMIRQDCGNAVAADTARCAVMPLARDGGQAQFIAYDPPGAPSNLSPLLQWIEERLDQELTLKDMAGQAAMSSRTLSRRFQEQLNTSPLKWLLRARVRRAQTLLETTNLPIEHIASAVGFGSPTSLREHFSRIVGVSPTAYRRSFNPVR